MPTIERPRSEIKKMLFISLGGAIVGTLAGVGIGLATHANEITTAGYGIGGFFGGGLLMAGLLGDIPAKPLNSQP